MRVAFSEEAYLDLYEIERYIREKLYNSQAAHRIANTIYNACMSLGENPKLGIEMKEGFPTVDRSRYLIAGKYIIFYKQKNADTVEIIRVFDTRQDYISKLLR